MTRRVLPVVRLIGGDDRTAKQLASILPQNVDLERCRSLDDAGPPPPSLTFALYRTNTIDEQERLRIERFLMAAPRRLVILCDRAVPSEVYKLTVVGAPLGLVSVESGTPLQDLLSRLLPWYWEGLIRPDWSALGAREEDPPYLMGRMMSMIEPHPFHDWRVDEIATKLRISTRTLNRATRQYFGQGVKSLLMALRYQLLLRARATNCLSWDDLADLFEFGSGKEAEEWYRAYGRRVKQVINERPRDGDNSG